MYEIKIYKNSLFGEIRTTTSKSGIPLFCLKDICNILKLRDSATVRLSLPDFYVDSIDVLEKNSLVKDGDPVMEKTKLDFVSEAGMYKIIFMNEIHNTQALIQWITIEVLPDMRKETDRLTQDILTRLDRLDSIRKWSLMSLLCNLPKPR